MPLDNHRSLKFIQKLYPPGFKKKKKPISVMLKSAGGTRIKHEGRSRQPLEVSDLLQLQKILNNSPHSTRP